MQDVRNTLTLSTEHCSSEIILFRHIYGRISQFYSQKETWVGAGDMVWQGKDWPCTGLSWVSSPALHRVPQLLLKVTLEHTQEEVPSIRCGPKIK